VTGDRSVDPDRILVARLGHGANCSSIGSVVDTLFVAAAVGTAVFAALAAALATEEVRVVGEDAGRMAPAASNAVARDDGDPAP
jgi:hypothetical protein